MVEMKEMGIQKYRIRQLNAYLLDIFERTGKIYVDVMRYGIVSDMECRISDIFSFYQSVIQLIQNNNDLQFKEVYLLFDCWEKVCLGLLDVDHCENIENLRCEYQSFSEQFEVVNAKLCSMSKL
ncbi:hypothetical protein [Listeria grandensis]|uniref:hypothetical protein n=1 Tax=Listeria grandensis TaxID=1494963 RepID=UPI00164D5D0A|nr:hypothetical protein [Listeria grandensis]MBC6315483.1 hypothetical protein [Listeria grandensis]